MYLETVAAPSSMTAGGSRSPSRASSTRVEAALTCAGTNVPLCTTRVSLPSRAGWPNHRTESSCRRPFSTPPRVLSRSSPSTSARPITGICVANCLNLGTAEGSGRCAGSGATGTGAVARLFSRFRSTLDSHLRKEEDVLFPFVERLERSLAAGEPAPAHAFGPLWLPIEILEGEHRLGDRLLDEMRPLWTRWRAEGDAPQIHQALCARMLALEADMERHTRLEDDVLFPRTITLEGR